MSYVISGKPMLVVEALAGTGISDTITIPFPHKGRTTCSVYTHVGGTNDAGNVIQVQGRTEAPALFRPLQGYIHNDPRASGAIVKVVNFTTYNTATPPAIDATQSEELFLGVPLLPEMRVQVTTWVSGDIYVWIIPD